MGVLFGEMHRETLWQNLYWRFRWNTIRHDTHSYIIIGGFTIDDFSIKSPIAKVYSSPIFHLIQYNENRHKTVATQ